MKTAFLTVGAIAALAAAVMAAPLESVAELYWQERYAEARTVCDSLLIETPDDYALVHMLGRILTDTHEYAEAVPHLEHCLSLRAPAWARCWSNLYLGICALNAGDKVAALDYWSAVIKGPNTSNASSTVCLYLQSCLDSKVYADWVVRDAPHVEFRFSPAISDLDYDAYAAAHESAYAFIAAWCGADEVRPIRYFVWDSREDAKEASRNRDTCIPTPGFNRATVSLVHVRRDQTIGHETAHVLSLRTLKPARISGLISEGLAVFLDMTKRDRMDTARATLRGHEGPVTIDALCRDWGTFPDTVSYPVAGAFVQMLVEKGGREKFLELFRDQTLARARAIYGADLDAWLDAFERDLNR